MSAEDPCTNGDHCCCCGPGEACCDCGSIMPDDSEPYCDDCDLPEGICACGEYEESE